MPCYICLEEGTMLTEKGCGCKGSLDIHASCFQEWVKTAVNPFMCPVCKTDYHASFLSAFMTMEEMMQHGTSSEEEDDELEGEALFYTEHGVPVVEVDGIIYFETDAHFSMYQHSLKMEQKSIRMDSTRKQRNAMRPCLKRSKMNHKSRSNGQIRMRK